MDLYPPPSDGGGMVVKNSSKEQKKVRSFSALLRANDEAAQRNLFRCSVLVCRSLGDVKMVVFRLLCIDSQYTLCWIADCGFTERL